MYAQIIALVKMPRRFAYFDYNIPKNTKINVGDLVLINLKHRDVFGVVRSISGKTNQKNIKTLKHKIKSVASEQDVRRLELIADNLAQSPSTIFTTSLNGISHSISKEQNQISESRSLSIETKTVEAVKSALQHLKHLKQLNFESSQEGSIALAHALIRKSKNQTLILCPREKDVKIYSQLLKSDAMLHGKTPISERKWIIENWQSGKIRTLVSTRQASLLPANKIELIIVIDAPSEDHVNYGRNPRFDSRLAAKLLADQHGSKLIFTGSFSRLEELDTKSIRSKKPELTLVDLGSQIEKTNLTLISETLKNAISNTLQKQEKVLVSYNSKGVARCLQCKSCGHIPTCGNCGAVPNIRIGDLICPVCKIEMWTPEKCPACQRNTLTKRGIGNQKIKSILEQEFPQSKIEIIDKDNPEPKSADILLVTEYYFQSVYVPFQKQRFGLIANLMIDKSLGTNYESSMITATRLHRLLHMAQIHRSECIIQTWLPDIIKEMLDSDKFKHQEFDLRKQYKLPPAFDMFVLSGDENRSISSNTDNRKDKIHELKKLPDKIKIQTHYQSYET